MNPKTIKKDAFKVSLYLLEDSIRGIIRKKEMNEIAIKRDVTRPTLASLLKKLRIWTAQTLLPKA